MLQGNNKTPLLWICYLRKALVNSIWSSNILLSKINREKKFIVAKIKLCIFLCCKAFYTSHIYCQQNKYCLKMQANLYITKSWSVAFNTAALTLRHISCHIILFFFSFLKYNFSYNFKMIFTIFSPINVAHCLFIYFHYHPIINPTHYLFIYFHYNPIINLYN